MCNNLEKKILTVCIPTYNRANNIKKNIIPLLNYFKGERNIHFLICNNDSKDNTNHLCKTLNKKFNNLSYFKISKKIDKEKFFEWSAKKVKSKFFFFLFDDDICLKKILEEVPNILLQSKNFSFLTFNRSMVYYSKDYPKKNLKKKLFIPSFSNQILKIDSKKHIQNVINNYKIFKQSPMVTNTIFNTNFFFQLKNKYKSLFKYGHMGDFNIAIYFLNKTKNFLYLDTPLVIYGQTTTNTSSQLHHNSLTMNEYRKWVKWFTKKYLSKMPIKEYTWSNCVVATIKDMCQTLRIKFNFNKFYYYILIKKDLAENYNYNSKDFFAINKKIGQYQIKLPQLIFDIISLEKIKYDFQKSFLINYKSIQHNEVKNINTGEYYFYKCFNKKIYFNTLVSRFFILIKIFLIKFRII